MTLRRKPTCWFSLLGLLFTGATLAVAAVTYQVRLRDDVDVSLRRDTDQESRLRSMEAGIGEMKADLRETRADVGWIRKFLDRPAREPDKVAN